MVDCNLLTPSHNDAALFQHLIDGIKDYAIFMIGLDGTILTWNPGVRRLLGYEENEFIGRSFSIIFSDEDQKLNIPESELHTAQSSGRAEDERWHRKKDGTAFWANGLVTLMKENGSPIGFAKIMRDQTQKKQFEQQIAEQANALAKSNKELTNFAGIVSHDLNAPLQTVYGFANLLKDQDGLDPEAEESVRHIVNGTKNMITLVRELLNFTTATDANEDCNFVNTADLLQEVLLDLTASITAHDASIHAADLPTVWANSVQLKRVFQNLVENALKYSVPARKPEIEISARNAETETIFSVQDNGRGIDQSKLTQIFTLFERLNPDDSISGKGIGLATCHKVIEHFGGKMWVESKVNEGSVFHFSLPHPVETAVLSSEQTVLLPTNSSTKNEGVNN